MAQAPQYHINNTEIVFETIQDETVIVNLETGSYYSLVGAGSVVWCGLASGRTTDEIIDKLMGEFDASPEELAHAVQELAQEMMQEGLVVFDAEPFAAASAAPAWDNPRDPAAPKREFRTPRLEKHTDMQELLLLDPVHDVDRAGWPRARNTSDA